MRFAADLGAFARQLQLPYLKKLIADQLHELAPRKFKPRGLSIIAVGASIVRLDPRFRQAQFRNCRALTSMRRLFLLGIWGIAALQVLGYSPSTFALAEPSMLEIEICIDVPDIAQAERFYASAFGFARHSAPYAGVVVMQSGAGRLTLLEKREQTRPSSNTQDVRRYDRHWTPVHLDFHVEDLRGALDQALDAGATQERLIEDAEHGSIAICADPFGHGFCLLERKPK